MKRYELEWWISELKPLLEEFVKASKGEVDKAFWRNMFKYHSQKQYGAPHIIDGWIVKFFPYDKEGKRNNPKQLEGTNCLPDDILLKLTKIARLDIKFTDKIDIPDEISKIKIGNLVLYGKITKEGLISFETHKIPHSSIEALKKAHDNGIKEAFK